MPRQARLDLPGFLQHITARGIDRCLIFRDDKDRMSFVNRLRAILKESGTKCYAWCLLPDRFHLLLETEKAPLRTVMRRLMTGYAVTFNKKYRRNGHLFENRYKSTLCEKEPYFLELVRCIHLKPLKFGLVKDLSELDSYPWAGHCALMGNNENDWHDWDEIFRCFGKRKDEAREGYRGFIEQGIKQGVDLVSRGTRSLLRAITEDDDPSDERILGSGEFVSRVLLEAGEGRQKKVKKIPLEDLARKITGHFNVCEEEFRSPLKKKIVTEAKAAFCHLAIREMGYTGREVGEFLNMAGYSAIRRSEYGRQVLENRSLDVSNLLV